MGSSVCMRALEAFLQGAKHDGQLCFSLERFVQGFRNLRTGIKAELKVS